MHLSVLSHAEPNHNFGGSHYYSVMIDAWTWLYCVLEMFVSTFLCIKCACLYCHPWNTSLIFFHVGSWDDSSTYYVCKMRGSSYCHPQHIRVTEKRLSPTVIIYSADSVSFIISSILLSFFCLFLLHSSVSVSAAAFRLSFIVTLVLVIFFPLRWPTLWPHIYHTEKKYKYARVTTETNN